MHCRVPDLQVGNAVGKKYRKTDVPLLEACTGTVYPLTSTLGVHSSETPFIMYGFVTQPVSSCLGSVLRILVQQAKQFDLNVNGKFSRSMRPHP